MLHALPGRLRVHLPGCSQGDQERGSAALLALPAVDRVRAGPLTGNLLVCFDAEAMDAAEMATHIRGLVAAGRPAGSGRRRRSPPPRRATGEYDERFDPTRLIWPIIHLAFSASPIGVALHVGELCWAARLLVARDAAHPVPAGSARRELQVGDRFRQPQRVCGQSADDLHTRACRRVPGSASFRIVGDRVARWRRIEATRPARSARRPGGAPLVRPGPLHVGEREPNRRSA